MKTVLFTTAALAMVHMAAAQPHHLRGHEHHKRDIITELEVVTVTAANVIVYVDENGVPCRTETEGVAAPTPEVKPPAPQAPEVNTPSAPAAAQPVVPTPEVKPSTPSTTTTTTTTTSSTTSSTSSATPTPSPPAQENKPVVEAPVAPVPTTTTTTSSTPSPTPTPSPAPAPAPSPEPQPETTTPEPLVAEANTESWPLGVTYSLLKGSNGVSQGCKDAAQVAQEVKQIEAAGYTRIRLYGTECSGIDKVLSAAGANTKILAGLYNIGGIQADVTEMKKQVNNRWSKVALVSIGNEVIRQNQPYTVAQWVQAYNDGKAALSQAGFKGPVTVVEEAGAMIDNKQLCQLNSDIVTVNAHAFFDTKVLPQNCGTFTKAVLDNVKKACGAGKTYIITESGWPKQGGANGQSVASPANQKTAIASLKAAFPNQLFLFSAFDEGWKAAAGGLSPLIEQSWGVIG